MNRRGVSVLLAVCALAFAIGLVAVAVHGLWRSSSRNLFSVHEHRELVNLGHSAVAEALWSVETKLEQGDSEWIDWCASALESVPPREEPVPVTASYVTELVGEGGNLSYTVSNVRLERIRGLPSALGMAGRLGVLDFIVTLEATRRAPAHRAKLVMTRRHAFWFSDGLTPFTRGGRHIEILATPVATMLEHL